MNENYQRTPEEIRQRRLARKKRKQRRQMRTTFIVVCAFLLGIIVGRYANSHNLANAISARMGNINETGAGVTSYEGFADKINAGMQTGLTEDELANIVVSAPKEYTLTSALQEFKELGKKDERYTIIVQNQFAYPEKLLLSLANNPELISFVADYMEKSVDAENSSDAKLTEAELAQKCPLFLQWDKRWGYQYYGDDSDIAVSGCGPTALAMVVVGLTGKAVTPGDIAKFSMDNNYYMHGTGTMWSLMTEGSKNYGIDVTQITMEKSQMEKCLKNDGMLICSMDTGDFTIGGHFIVIYDMDEEGFMINDPFCIYRSEQKWTFDQLDGQVKGVWTAYS